MTPKVGFAAILPPFSLHRLFYGLVQSFLKGESFLLLESGKYVRVCVERYGDARMPKSLLDHLWGNSCHQQECRVGVTEVVERPRNVSAKVPRLTATTLCAMVSSARCEQPSVTRLVKKTFAPSAAMAATSAALLTKNTNHNPTFAKPRTARKLNTLTNTLI